MEKFVLSTDTCCDELKSNLKKNRIEFIKMAFICDGEIFEDNFDSVEEYKFFYDEMKRGKVYSTTGLNHFQVKEYFTEILERTKSDIVHVCLSSGLSGTHSVVCQVAEEINKTSPNKVYILDSKCATQGQNAVLTYAMLLRNEGRTALETKEILNKEIGRLCVTFFLGDLEALKRGGRISGAQAAIAKMVQLRPVLKFDPEGKLQIIEKAIGSKKAIKSLFDRFAKRFDPNSPIPIFLAYAGDPTNMNELRKMIEERFGITNIITGPVGPVICSHTGPSLTGLIYLEKQ